MTGIFGFLSRNYKINNPPTVPKSRQPIRFGILGAARIAPNALILPAKTHPEVEVVAVAARDKTKAEKFAKKHGISKVYSGSTGYQDLLNDPNVDAVYNPLPNGLHFEWSMKALEAGKHVLLEKPMCNTEDETRRLTDYAKSKGLIIMEAFHYRFHPGIHRTKELVGSGNFGKIEHITANLAVPKLLGVLEGKDDIRLKYSLGGGCMMDMGVYTLSVARMIAGSNPTEVKSVSNILAPGDKEVDVSSSVELAFPDGVTASLYCNFEEPALLGFIPTKPKIDLTVKLEGGTICYSNFPGPHILHVIKIEENIKGKVSKREETAYTFASGPVKGEEYWSTYRYMLEAFVNRLKNRAPHHWVDAQESIDNMHWLDKIYEKAGLSLRPNSTYSPAA